MVILFDAVLQILMTELIFFFISMGLFVWVYVCVGSPERIQIYQLFLQSIHLSLQLHPHVLV